MKYLGIDYGKKRIGLAVSDNNGRVAFPLEVLKNDERFFEKLRNLVKEKSIQVFVVGESLNYKGEKNFIMSEIEDLVFRLKKEFSLPVIYESEFLSSVQALNMGIKLDKIDAGAATVILQAYIDKKINHDDKYKKDKESYIKLAEKENNEKKYIEYEDFTKLDMRVGKILTVEKIKNADRLLLLQVDFAEEKTRQVVSGIAEYFKDGEGLVGKDCLFVVNLKPRMIRGFESQAMIIAVKDNNKLGLFVPDTSISIGLKAN